MGELKKIIKNKLFLLIVFVILAANIVAVLYCMETRSEAYYAYKQEEQQQYIHSYQVFIDEMKSRGDELLEALDADDTSFVKRDVEKTEHDYNGLSGLELDSKYNEGIVSYAGYNYGIFFCILFSFVCLEYVYLFEKRTAMLQVLRTTKKGRRQMILSKWFVYLLLLLAFSIVQEFVTIGLYGVTRTLGDLQSPIQSIQIFRDCPNAFSLLQGILVTIGNRILLALTIGSIVFMAGIVINSIAKAILLPCVFLGLQYILSVTVSVYGSYDAFCCVNLFHSWNMEHYIGLYHNLNMWGIPVEKNMVVHVLGVVIIVCSVVFGTTIFSIRYQKGYIKFESKLIKYIRKFCSMLLHKKSMFINEWYRLFFQQRKWMLFVLFLSIVFYSRNQYNLENLYQTSYEAVYHMHLSNIEGRIDDKTEQYMKNEQEYLDTLKKKMDEAMDTGDSIVYSQLEAEYTGREDAFERLRAQYKKALDSTGNESFLIDEMNLDEIFHKYDRDVLLFMTTAITLILMISGLFASEKENKIEKLIISTRNGRNKLFYTKIKCSIFCTTLLFVLSQLPSWKGYATGFETDCLKQKLCDLYEPEINSMLSIIGLLGIVYLLKYLIAVMIVMLTILTVRKTKSEFVTSAFLCTVVIITCLVFYFLKSNITLIVTGFVG